MIWQNPWAWLGLTAIALPVLIHLLGRGHARVRRFPTLRFIDPSRLLPTRRTRIEDLLLLAVRISILIIAVAALAQPLIVTSRRSSAANASLARALIVDTSGARETRLAIDSINRVTHLAADATVSTVIATGDVSSSIPGAVAWLATQPMRGDIAIISQFRETTLDSVDVAAIPPRVGVHLLQAPATTHPLEVRTRTAGEETVARITPSAERTDVEWSATPATHAAAITSLSGASERRRADAAQAAAGSIPIALPRDTASPIMVVAPGYEGRGALIASSTQPRRAWMMDAVIRIASDSDLVSAARRAAVIAAGDTAGTVVVARTDSGRPVVLAGESTTGGREQLVFYSLADAGSLTSAALLVGAARATSLAPPPSWLAPTTVSAADLSRWQRDPAQQENVGEVGSQASDGRWLWLVVLALLALETWMRRTRRVAERQDIARDRAA